MKTKLRLRRVMATAGLGAAVLSTFVAPSASASSGWDNVGYATYDVNPSFGPPYYPTGTVALSSGGNFKACVQSSAGSKYSFVLYEDDSGNADDVVGKGVRGNDGCIVFDNIGRFVDGSNNRAEFFLVSYDPTATHVTYYD